MVQPFGDRGVMAEHGRIQNDENIFLKKKVVQPYEAAVYSFRLTNHDD